MFRTFRNWLFRKKTSERQEEHSEPFRKTNPYLPWIRPILEEVLGQRDLDYGRMQLLLIDTDMEPESMLDEDDMKTVLDGLSRDLNFLTILTERPAYFHDYVEKMYEENGLLVHLQDKKSSSRTVANVILDLEQRGPFPKEMFGPSALYIPLYKKRWERTNNLDISVPIGYNTVIVKGIENANA